MSQVGLDVLTGIRRATVFLILAALWYPTAAVGQTEGVTVEWIVSDAEA